jgi:hypothetical protein
VAEVELDRALSQRLFDESAGKTRLVLNGIATIERICATNGTKKATTEMFAGVPLCADWQGRRTRGVKAASQ